MNAYSMTERTGSAIEEEPIVPLAMSTVAQQAHLQPTLTEQELFQEMMAGDIVLYSATGKEAFRTSAFEMATDRSVSSAEDIVEEAAKDKQPAERLALRIDELEDQVADLKCILLYFEALKDERSVNHEGGGAAFLVANGVPATARQGEV